MLNVPVTEISFACVAAAYILEKALDRVINRKNGTNLPPFTEKAHDKLCDLKLRLIEAKLEEILKHSKQRRAGDDSS